MLDKLEALKRTKGDGSLCTSFSLQREREAKNHESGILQCALERRVRLPTYKYLRLVSQAASNFKEQRMAVFAPLQE
ncbi:hypothetical protein BH23ACT10_BH23ACT10_23080 [soil metagenome]